eukprot:577645-Rhodomonas_salina.2
MSGGRANGGRADSGGDASASDAGVAAESDAASGPSPTSGTATALTACAGSRSCSSRLGGPGFEGGVGGGEWLLDLSEPLEVGASGGRPTSDPAPSASKSETLNRHCRPSRWQTKSSVY